MNADEILGQTELHMATAVLWLKRDLDRQPPSSALQSYGRYPPLSADTPERRIRKVFLDLARGAKIMIRTTCRFGEETAEDERNQGALSQEERNDLKRAIGDLAKKYEKEVDDLGRE